MNLIQPNLINRMAALRMRKIKIFMMLDSLIQVTENHGGYQAGTCLCCGAMGWISGLGRTYQTPRGSHLTHKKSCPVGKALVKHGGKFYRDYMGPDPWA